jgi:hypoxanthine phosphoribosyltransferase
LEEQKNIIPQNPQSMDIIKVYDKEFALSITPAQIQNAVAKIAEDMNRDLAGENPIFLSILNGSFMFTSDLLKKIRMDCQVSFIKFSSYEGVSSAKRVKKLIGIDDDVTGRSLVVLEDIIDTGNTIRAIVKELKLLKAKQIKIATLFLKPAMYQGNIQLDYVGLEMPNDFIVGYGLDYNQLGRNYEGIYKIIQ